MNVIELAAISKSYGRRRALHEFDLKIAEGDVFGLLGRLVQCGRWYALVKAYWRSAMPDCLRLPRHFVRMALALAFESDGITSDASTPMMTTTTRISTSVIARVEWSVEVGTIKVIPAG
ncbi:MAG: hypothetical protein QF886_11530 [Planctomycetota bacterium]|nr:hypothetical protein [Planctomycetota bacterium]